MANQNDVLIKRIDDLESRNSRKFQNSNSVKSFSTLNNTLNTLNENEIDELTSPNMQANITPSMQKNNNVDFTEWKRDIEKSIEKISERVAGSNSNVLVSLLEKRVNDMNNELAKLKKNFDENVDSTNIIKKNVEKFDRTEKLIGELLTQISTMKSNATKWNSDFLKSLNDFDAKIASQENIIEQFEKFEKITNKRIDQINNEYKNLHNTLSIRENTSEDRLNLKIKSLEDTVNYLTNENIKISHKLREEVIKNESIYKIVKFSF